MAAGMIQRPSDRERSADRRQVERRVYIKASPREVWATLHDSEFAAALFEELALGPADPSWPAAGSARSGEAHLGLLRTAVRVESLEARPQSRFRVAVVARSFVIDWGWQMEPRAGGTRVIHNGTFQTTDRLAGVLVRLGRDSIGGLAEAHLRALKEKAEGISGEAAGPAA
jgi:hypothetical protein